ncbi:hypothetical protein SELMODRAFT_87668 [Selaginella moellendorffii]|uniref:FAD-binding PCMH-type domain-containing protein n=1 Tax=Selaginella moellendorffii TaxID=88036 RepID=D8R8V4_SELML|nr:uncharacterized FAD-linked oxidoreductase ARB_02478 [Selaginella moellendorffii]EFJ32125.1 hypothetical protein SELMODRAFT_87668 [Selaginella moellendorffii]|eukprot:XP_002967526.1 uncharacterized FAD-linked oxidoreductase ARB_02478 [Selaginella moellendorffii]
MELSFHLILLSLLLSSYGESSCKCTPRSSCWPSSTIWSAFNRSIDGRLLAPKPYAWPCHTPQYDPVACSAARQLQNNPFARSEVVGAMQYPNWESGITGFGCPLNGTGALSSPCYQDDVSIYAINVSSVSHIQAGVVFAKKYNLRLVIKSSGHDWLGRSTAPGSLCIWLHHLTNIFTNDSFVPQSCPVSDPVPAVTAQPGVTWDFLYDFLRQRNRVAVGPMGSSPSAAGGFVQGGGHGPLSRTFGYAADNALEFTVVTADGRVRVANRCRNPDLFWALKGGGGGTFGVVVSATYRTFPDLQLGYVQTLFIAASATRSSHEDLIAKFVEVTPSMDEARLAGYFFLYTNYITLSFVLPNGTAAEARAAFAPLVSYVEGHPQLLVITYTVTSYPNFVQWHDGVLCATNPGVCTDLTGAPRALATRFMPRTIIQDSPAVLTNALVRILFERSFSPIFGLFVFGGAAASVQGRNNSLSAVWRDALWHVSLSRTWNDSTTVKERQQIFQYLTTTDDILRNITPGGGCYKNEADYFEPYWQDAFFGEKYSALKAIKESVDPTRLFLCWKCVGSENLVQGNCKAAGNRKSQHTSLT